MIRRVFGNFVKSLRSRRQIGTMTSNRKKIPDAVHGMPCEVRPANSFGWIKEESSR